MRTDQRRKISQRICPDHHFGDVQRVTANRGISELDLSQVGSSRGKRTPYPQGAYTLNLKRKLGES